MRPRGVSGWTVGAGLLLAGMVRAESTLEWRTPDGCPGHARVVERIEELAPSALAAAIALALRPPVDDASTAVDSTPAPTPRAALETEVPAAPPPSSEPTVPTEPPAPHRGPALDPFVRLLGGTDVAVFPAGAAAFELDLGVRLREVVSLEGGAILLPPARYSVGAGAEARFWLGAGALRLCAHTHEGRIGVAACAGAELGSITAEGEGVSEAARRQVSWIAPVAGLLASWPLGERVRLVGLGTALVPLVRHDFRIAPDPPFHVLPSVDGRLTVGLQVGAR